jgi:hypothetical protein
MKKALILLLIFGFVAGMAGVFFPETEMGHAVADTTMNPNGSSELSVLMREMQQYTNQAKKDIRDGKKPAQYPASFDKINTAKVSDGMNKSDFYKSFADLYMMSVKNYVNSTPEHRIETYNNMVAACLACHSQHCPGPVPVIRKMTLEVK